jgi:hypothetical protein
MDDKLRARRLSFRPSATCDGEILFAPDGRYAVLRLGGHTVWLRSLTVDDLRSSSDDVALRPFQRLSARKCLKIRRGAGDETRTRDIFLGKEVLYQLSYTRVLSIEGMKSCVRRGYNQEIFADDRISRFSEVPADLESSIGHKNRERTSCC